MIASQNLVMIAAVLSSGAAKQA